MELKRINRQTFEQVFDFHRKNKTKFQELMKLLVLC